MSHKSNLCEKCRINKANPGRKWCQNCFSTQTVVQKCSNCNDRAANPGRKWCEQCFNQLSSQQAYQSNGGNQQKNVIDQRSYPHKQQNQNNSNQPQQQVKHLEPQWVKVNSNDLTNQCFYIDLSTGASSLTLSLSDPTSPRGPVSSIYPIIENTPNFEDPLSKDLPSSNNLNLLTNEMSSSTVTSQSHLIDNTVFSHNNSDPPITDLKLSKNNDTASPNSPLPPNDTASTIIPEAPNDTASPNIPEAPNDTTISFPNKVKPSTIDDFMEVVVDWLNK